MASRAADRPQRAPKSARSRSRDGSAGRSARASRPSNERPSRPPSARASSRNAASRAGQRVATLARQKPVWTIVAALGFVLLVGAVLFGVHVYRFASRAPEGAAGFVEISWPEETSSSEAASILAEAGLVPSARDMAIYLWVRGGTEDFVPGPHLLPRAATPSELRQYLVRDPDRPRAKLTIPEGFHRVAIASRLESLGIATKDGFLKATTDIDLLDELGIVGPGGRKPESAEGYLFPATYELPRDLHPRDVVRRLVQEADGRWRKLAEKHGPALAKLAADLSFERADIVTLASIVEKEAGVDDERPIIASVFLNRLTDPEFKPKRLQSDPTSAYGCVVSPDEIPACATFRGKVTPAINRDAANRYSTYVHERLPPGPIANPGDRSLEAVLAPANTRFFYFVAKGAGRHHFSETLAEHNASIKAPPKPPPPKE